MVGTADNVLIREVSVFQSVLYREVPLYLPTGRNTIVQSVMLSHSTVIGDQ